MMEEWKGLKDSLKDAEEGEEKGVSGGIEKQKEGRDGVPGGDEGIREDSERHCLPRNWKRFDEPIDEVKDGLTLELDDSVTRVIVVGDVHGCSEELALLMKKCDFNPTSDRLVCVGDLVGKGPDSRGVIDLVKEYSGISVLGNHELCVMNWKVAVENGTENVAGFKLNPRGEHRQLARTFESKYIEFIEEMPWFIRIPKYNCLVAHAGIVPKAPLTSTTAKEITHMRSITTSESDELSVTDKMVEGSEWAKFWTGPELLLYGHDAYRGLQKHPMAVGLDTGCCYGRQLSAIILPSKEIVQVDALKMHCTPVTKPGFIVKQ
eukprot:Nk52_evm94s2192 gene=Nk52_evmTU94s2192